MDLAKLCAVLLAHGGEPRDYFGEEKVPGPILPLVCVPTTAGTGSEVTQAAVLTDEENHIKVSTLSQWLRPRAAIVDPRLTLTCPAKVTADSGVDALTHAIEAYTAVDNAQFPVADGGVTAYQGRNVLSDAMAETAMRLIAEHLAGAVIEPDNLAAREGMALAALTAGLAFSNSGVALVHALEYPVGGAVHCSHGAGNGLLLPHVMRFNLPKRTRQFVRVAELLGENVESLSEHAAAERAVVAVERLCRAVGIPSRLRDIGVRQEQLSEFAAKAFAIKRLLRVNPRSASEADLLGILTAAY
jgi:alcohol dehydrogenase class IV